MHELIWFSVPGAILVWGYVLAFQNRLQSDGTVLVGATIIVGFIFHQVFRVIFEAAGGWHFWGRTVISEIVEAYGLRQRRDAFLVWELTFYSKNIDPSFRDHCRGAWHYILSFLSACLAAVIASIMAAATGHWEAIVFVLIAILFLVKACQTFKSLQDQETAVFRINREHFNLTHDRLYAAASQPLKD